MAKIKFGIRGHGLGVVAAWVLGFFSSVGYAETPQNFLDTYAREVRVENPNFKGFSASAGAAFYKNTHGAEWRCASCHTDSPTSLGEHVVTHKQIQPLSPVANPARFTDATKVNKWFKRNCNDVVQRECTAEEKGNVLTYLLSVKP